MSVNVVCVSDCAARIRSLMSTICSNHNQRPDGADTETLLHFATVSRRLSLTCPAAFDVLFHVSEADRALCRQCMSTWKTNTLRFAHVPGSRAWVDAMSWHDPQHWRSGHLSLDPPHLCRFVLRSVIVDVVRLVIVVLFRL